MKNNFRIISLLIIVIILMPALFFSGYEIMRMNKNEQELESIFKKQLDAILFSINVYSDDILSNWASKIRTSNAGADYSDSGLVKKTLVEIPQIKSIVFSSDTLHEKSVVYSLDTTVKTQLLIERVKKLLSDSSKKLIKLKSFYKSGYSKIEELGEGIDNSSMFMVFYLGGKGNYNICLIEINEGKFIRELLGQKIQITAEDKMNIGVADTKSGDLIYTCGNINNASEFQMRKQIWLFPRYQLGIQLKDTTIASLSKERNKRNLFIILIADIVFILGAMLVFRNVRKEIRLTQIKSEFISNVSHEIRTPLALISMYAETLEMDRVKSEEKKKEYYQVIESETQRLSGIVNRILNFSKMENGKRTYSFALTDLNSLVSRVNQSYSFYLKNKGFEFKMNPDPDIPSVKIDEEAIGDALVNLIDNAVKYSGDIKHIEITTGSRERFVFVQVTDKGIGIAKEDQKLIFDKFYRVQKGAHMANVARGTGLGLAIVKNIIEAHHGKIEIESKPGSGSTFRLLFLKPEHHG